MSQKNLTPDPTDYILGRGKGFVTLLDSNGNKIGGMRFLGNMAEVTATVEGDNYTHYSATESVKQKDLEILLTQDQTWTATLETISKENLNLFFAGEEDDTYSGGPAITGFSDQVLVADGEMESEASSSGGRWYQIMSGGVNVFNLTATNAVTLESTNDSPVSLVENTDYTIDLKTGRVFFLDSTAVQSIISNEEGVTVSATADATATPVSKLLTGTKAGVSAEIRFEHINANSQETDIVYIAPKVKITANGDASLIGDEAMQLPITIGLEKHPSHSQVLYVHDLRD